MYQTAIAALKRQTRYLQEIVDGYNLIETLSGMEVKADLSSIQNFSKLTLQSSREIRISAGQYKDLLNPLKVNLAKEIHEWSEQLVEFCKAADEVMNVFNVMPAYYKEKEKCNKLIRRCKSDLDWINNWLKENILIKSRN